MAKAKLSSAVLFLSSQLTFQAESSQKSWIKCKSKVSKVSESRGAVGAGGTETSEGEALRDKDEGEVLGDKLRTSVCSSSFRAWSEAWSMPSRGEPRLRAQVLAGELPSSLLVRAMGSIFW